MTSVKTKSVDRHVHFNHVVTVHRMMEVVDRSSPWMHVRMIIDNFNVEFNNDR